MSDTTQMAGDFSRGLVRLVVRLYYPRIEVESAGSLPEDAQILFVANHANSLIDPVIMGIATGRRIHYLAKAPLFDVPVMGQALKALGMIPAFRGSDDKSQVRRNLESLDVAARQLAAGRDVGIFPEGKSHDETHVEQVRSGAARIALNAVAEGADKLLIVPIGLNYERKEQFRSSVWARIGEPIDVNAWLADHEGDQRKAARSLTTRIDRGLKEVVIHLDQADWEPWLNDLEILDPESRDRGKDPIEALRHRKRLADGINWFMTEDPDRAKDAAAAIREHRERLEAAGLTVRSALVRYRTLWVGWLALRQIVILCAGVAPWLGTVFHLAPFLIVRTITGKINQPGRVTMALNRLYIGLPVYALWYFLAWRWLAGYFLPWLAWTVCFLMPFAGLWALDYCRRARDTARLWWRESAMLFRRKELKELRAAQQALSDRLEGMSREFREARGLPEAIRRPVPAWAVALRYLGGAAALAATLAVAALAYGWFKPPAMPELAPPSPDLRDHSASSLAGPIAADEAVLTELAAELDRLKLRVAGLRADFESGRRNFIRQEDNDAVRRSMMTYIACRTGLLRIVWKYRNFDQIRDPATRLRASLLALTAATSTYSASLDFVTQFMDSADAVRKLNEAEPLWHVPEGLFDRIQRNLVNDDLREQLEAAMELYHGWQPQFEANGLGGGSEVGDWHRRIARNLADIEAGREQLSGAHLDVAIKGAKGLGKEGVYRTQTFISYWIGKAKVRAPREGQTLIHESDLEELLPRLQPGDIMIERRNWVLSNAFLPGFWSHTALYLGEPEQLEALGLKEDPRVAEHWKAFTTPDEKGHRLRSIEALAPGVIFTSMEHSVGEADAVCILRPRISEADRADCIARAISHLGKPYDFEFDFFSTDKLVCTELIYRAFDGRIDLPLVEIMGTRTMPAMEIVRKFEREHDRADAQLELIAFLDGDEETGKARLRDAAALIESLDRSSFTWLQSPDGD